MEPRFGHDFSKMGIHSTQESFHHGRFRQKSAEHRISQLDTKLKYRCAMEESSSEDEQLLYRRPLGVAACNTERGIVEKSVFEEHCAGNCVEQHEDQHVEDMTLCCERYGRCIQNASTVDGRNKCREKWIEYWNHIDDWTECNAYNTEDRCLQNLLRDQCATRSSKTSEECCQSLQKQFNFVEDQVRERCPKALPWPCGFSENGEILKI
jgi:hypothetical protein